MAQELKNITLGASGFLGLNTQDSPVEMNRHFAETANNGVIDKYGRLGARKGYNVLTADTDTALGGESVKVLGEWTRPKNQRVLIASGNNGIFRVDSVSTDYDTLTPLSVPAGYNGGSGITADDWQMVDFNKKMYFVQKDHEPLVLTETSNVSNSLESITSESVEASPIGPEGHCAIGAYGRLWIAGVPDEPSKVYWSDLYIGEGFTEGSSGSIDITTVWPNGYDEIVALGSHNDRLIIFGKHSIVTYAGATSPANMVLDDTVNGVGCVHRDTVQGTGGDLVFLSWTGVQSFGRAVLQSSLPFNEVSKFVRQDVIDALQEETEGMKSVYSPESGFYLLNFLSSKTTYCFDFKSQLEEGARKTTLWPNSPFTCYVRGMDGKLFVGGAKGVGKYEGYRDAGKSYRYQYYGPILTFDLPSRLKILKKIRPVMIGGANVYATVSWGYGFTLAYSHELIPLGQGDLSEYGLDEYMDAEYSGGLFVTDTSINATGSGAGVRLGVGVDIDGEPFSLQEISVQSLIGRLI